MDNLNALSKLMPEIDSSEVKNIREIMKTIKDKKYLLTSSFLKLISRQRCLLIKIFIGFTCEIKSLIENLNKAYSFKKRKPELVEKKDPPIITRIKNKKDKLFGESLKEIPKFETLLDIETNVFKKLFSKLKKTKINEIIIKRYMIK